MSLTTIKFMLRDDLDAESMMELLYLIDFLKSCSKEFYMDKKSEELFADGFGNIIEHGKEELSNKDLLKLILKKVERVEGQIASLKDEFEVVEGNTLQNFDYKYTDEQRKIIKKYTPLIVRIYKEMGLFPHKAADLFLQSELCQKLQNDENLEKNNSISQLCRMFKEEMQE